MQVGNMFKNQPYNRPRFSVWVHSTGRRNSALEEPPVEKKEGTGGTRTHQERTGSQRTSTQEETSQMADDFDYGYEQRDETSLSNEIKLPFHQNLKYTRDPNCAFPSYSLVYIRTNETRFRWKDSHQSTGIPPVPLYKTPPAAT